MPLVSTMALAMTGEIRLRGWLPFRALQVPGADGRPRFHVGGARRRPPMVGTGANTHVDGRGSLQFRGGAAASPWPASPGPTPTAAWPGGWSPRRLCGWPPALTPVMGAAWDRGDSAHATVSMPAGHDTIHVTVTVACDGRFRAVQLHRCGASGDAHAGVYPFDGGVDAEATLAGVTIPSVGCVGWWWGTDRHDDGVFFRYRIAQADYRAGASPQPPDPPLGGR